MINLFVIVISGTCGLICALKYYIILAHLHLSPSYLQVCSNYRVETF